MPESGQPPSPTDSRPPASPGAASRPVAPPLAPRRSLPAPPVGPPPPPRGHGGGGGGGGGGSRGRGGWPVAVAGVVVVLALLGAVLMVRNTGSDTGGEPEPVPETTTTTAKPATEEEVRAAVDEISAFVEDERGLEFHEPVKVELADDDEFESRLLEDFDEDADELESTGVVLAALGLLDPDADIVAAMRELLGGGVVGFYDSETAELVVRGTAITPYVRTVVAHELTHALDDQHFELDRPALDDADDESGFGFQSLVEGNARRVEDAYLASLSEDDQQAAFTEQFQMAGDIDITAIPQVLVEQITAPYALGEGFVDVILDEGGQARLDAAFASPPTTSEQVVEPNTFLAGEGAVEVAAPSVGGEVVEDGALGQLLVTEVLEGELDGDEVAEAAAGWGGDWAVAWRDGDRRCLTARIVGDTPDDTARLTDAFTDWAEAHGDATVTPGEGDAPFTVEACAA